MLPTLTVPPTAPWRIELVVVARSRRSSAERMAISRDVQRGILVRVGAGVYAGRPAFEALSAEARHVVRMRALRATTVGPLVFSHFSAAVLHGLPVLRTRLDRLHVSVEDEDDRHRTGIAHHFFLLDDAEGVHVGELTATGLGRTVVDVAGAAPFDEAVMSGTPRSDTDSLGLRCGRPSTSPASGERRGGSQRPSHSHIPAPSPQPSRVRG